jgi:hypothetical protein
MCSRGGYLRALGFGVRGTKSDDHEALFIVILVPTRRGCGVLPFLSINQTPNLALIKRFWKGKSRVCFDMGN